MNNDNHTRKEKEEGEKRKRLNRNFQRFIHSNIFPEKSGVEKGRAYTLVICEICTFDLLFIYSV